MKSRNFISEIVSEALGDAETIAKSALAMVIERTNDLDQNPIVALVMLEALTEMAIEEYRKNCPKAEGVSMENGLRVLRGVIGKGIKEQFDQYKQELRQ